MEPSISKPTTQRKATLMRGAVLVALGAAIFGVGYHQGGRTAEPQRKLEEISQLPAAKGFLDYPNTYTIEVMRSGAGEREIYLRNKREGVEVRLSDATPRLINAYSGHGYLMMEGMMRTIEGSRWLYDKVGGTPQRPQPVQSEHAK
jgi:hypothetical protein